MSLAQIQVISQVLNNQSVKFIKIMNYPSYFKKSTQSNLHTNPKTQQNKPNTINTKKNYDEDQDSYIVKGSDSFEVKDLKGKLKVVMQKLVNLRKQKEQLHKENQNLQKQIITLGNNVRHMIPGFNNTSSNFPMPNQIVAKLLQFYKCQCLDRFFQNLCPQQLSMKGVIYFYHFSFSKVFKLVDDYFEETFSIIKTTGCLQTLDGPIMNVLRKSFQTTFEKILGKIIEKDDLSNISSALIQKLSLNSEEEVQLQNTMTDFLQKLLELCLYCRISDPPLSIQTQSIGKKIKYNSIFNDPLDGFIKNKQQCWVVLPQIRKTENQQIVVKSLVLKTDYFDQEEGESSSDIEN